MQETQETWVWSPGWEDSLEKEMATYSSILAWKIPWREDPGRLQSMWLQRVRHDWAHMPHGTVTNWTYQFLRLSFAFVYTLKSSALSKKGTHTQPSKCLYAHLQSLPPAPLCSISCQPKETADLLSANTHFHSLEFYVRGIIQYVLCFAGISLSLIILTFIHMITSTTVHFLPTV